jgi:hypothetical protein
MPATSPSDRRAAAVGSDLAGSDALAPSVSHRTDSTSGRGGSRTCSR